MTDISYLIAGGCGMVVYDMISWMLNRPVDVGYNAGYAAAVILLIVGKWTGKVDK